MIHHRIRHETTDPAHYAVSHDAFGRVLVQIGDAYGEQLRVSLTPDQAWHFAQRLRDALHEAEGAADAQCSSAQVAEG